MNSLLQTILERIEKSRKLGGGVVGTLGMPGCDDGANEGGRWMFSVCLANG